MLRYQVRGNEILSSVAMPHPHTHQHSFLSSVSTKLQLTDDVFPNEREGNLKGQAWNSLLGKSRMSNFWSEVELHWA